MSYKTISSLFIASLMLGGCQSTGANTSLQSASLYGASDAQLHSRMQTTCMFTQEKMNGGSYDERWPKCECYATQTLKAISTSKKMICETMTYLMKAQKTKP